MIVVTGGAGFIGSNIVAALAADREAEIVVADWLGTDDRWRNLAKHDLADMVEPDELIGYLERHADQVEAVIHMGANSSTTEPDVDLLMDRNFRFSMTLWSWCTRRQARLIYASSAATYGDGGAGFADGHERETLARYRPMNPYGWSKHLFDRRVGQMVESNAPRPPQWAGLKFFNVYGPNEYHKGDMRSVIVKIYPEIAAGRPVRLFKSHRPDYADGGQLRDFVCVDDCVEVVRWLLDRPEVSGLFNLWTGQARSFADLAAATFAAAGGETEIEYFDMPEEIRERYQYFTEADMTRLRAAGYDRPFSTLEDGVRRYVQDYLATDDPYR